MAKARIKPKTVSDAEIAWWLGVLIGSYSNVGGDKKELNRAFIVADAIMKRLFMGKKADGRG